MSTTQKIMKPNPTNTINHDHINVCLIKKKEKYICRCLKCGKLTIYQSNLPNIYPSKTQPFMIYANKYISDQLTDELKQDVKQQQIFINSIFENLQKLYLEMEAKSPNETYLELFQQIQNEINQNNNLLVKERKDEQQELTR